jgi:probable rRNA maturation factor
MILLDPDLDPDPTSQVKPPARPGGSAQTATPRKQRIPHTRTLARFLGAAQAAVKLRGQVTVLLTTDPTIRRLNRQFRRKNKATDVLSFPANAPGPMKIAGDLAISIAIARRQAEERGHSLTTEIKVLMLHGLLHLAGYDHETDKGEMARREQKLRAKLRLPHGLIERATTPATKLGPGRATKLGPGRATKLGAGRATKLGAPSMTQSYRGMGGIARTRKGARS